MGYLEEVEEELEGIEKEFDRAYAAQMKQIEKAEKAYEDEAEAVLANY